MTRLCPRSCSDYRQSLCWANVAVHSNEFVPRAVAGAQRQLIRIRTSAQGKLARIVGVGSTNPFANTRSVAGDLQERCVAQARMTRELECEQGPSCRLRCLAASAHRGRLHRSRAGIGRRQGSVASNNPSASACRPETLGWSIGGQPTRTIVLISSSVRILISKSGGASGIRTPDPLPARQVLSR
jgi:hypothetical protein